MTTLLAQFRHLTIRLRCFPAFYTIESLLEREPPPGPATLEVTDAALASMLAPGRAHGAARSAQRGAFSEIRASLFNPWVRRQVHARRAADGRPAGKRVHSRLGQAVGELPSGSPWTDTQQRLCGQSVSLDVFLDSLPQNGHFP